MISACINNDGFAVTGKARRVARLVGGTDRNKVWKFQARWHVFEKARITVGISSRGDEKRVRRRIHRVNDRLLPDGEKLKRFLLSLIGGLIPLGPGEPLFEFLRIIAPTQIDYSNFMLGAELADPFEICRHPMSPVGRRREMKFTAQTVVEPKNH